MRKYATYIVAVGTGAMLALTGCKSESESHTTTTGTERSQGRIQDDKTITENVQTGLDQDPAYKFTDVNVQTYAGIVQLSGFVNTEGQRQRASQIAQAQSGVSQVQNNISLKPQPTMQPTARMQPTSNVQPTGGADGSAPTSKP